MNQLLLSHHRVPAVQHQRPELSRILATSSSKRRIRVHGAPTTPAPTPAAGAPKGNFQSLGSGQARARRGDERGAERRFFEFVTLCCGLHSIVSTSSKTTKQAGHGGEGVSLHDWSATVENRQNRRVHGGERNTKRGVGMSGMDLVSNSLCFIFLGFLCLLQNVRLSSF
ncbi:hypothetical protein C8J57DRAFT_1288375 [Mycena rebaudengoi]|nr:hypothetical protein C8J57DRAFT_1288375 [Mycena rebaudengoi]